MNKVKVIVAFIASLIISILGVQQVYAAELGQLGLTDYGIAVGKKADLVILDTISKANAIIDLPTRLVVIKNGRVTVENTKETIIHA